MLVLIVTLVPALAPALNPAGGLKNAVAAAREMAKAAGLAEKEIRTRADFLAPDVHRLPIVDRFLEEPLSLPGEAWSLFGPFLGTEEGVEATLRRAFELLLGEVPAAPAVPKGDDLRAAILSLFTGRAGDPPDPAKLDAELAPLPRAARPVLARLILAIDTAAREREAAFSRLSETEWVRLRQYGSQINTGAPASMQADIIGSLHARVDRRRLLAAALPLAREIDALPARLKELPPAGTFHVVLETPAGRVVFGGQGADKYPDDALLTFDFGGDDFYADSAGGTLYTPQKTSVCVDLAGDDVYRTTVGLAQGSGAYGIGMLADFAGDDVYETLNVSQGAAHLGVGVLLDAGGDDRYVARSVSQGAGFEGVGLLLDAAGRDVYRLGTLGQGLGLTAGLGLLLDRAGDDDYRAGGPRA
jgi:hypothetical protein